jgi:AMP phosphorylase
VHAKRDGFVGYIDNHSLVAIAKATGAPFEIEGGIEMLHKVGDAVKEGDVLFRIYAGSKPLLERAIESARSRRPMAVVAEPPEITEGPMVVERIPTKEMLDLIRFRS